MTERKSYDVAVIGAGVFGAWIAYYLAKSGASVALLDSYGPANSRGSSGGESRIIRMGYGADDIYTRWSLRAPTVVEQSQKIGVQYRAASALPPFGEGRVTSLMTTHGENISAGAFVYATGPWLAKLFPELLGPRLFISRPE